MDGDTKKDTFVHIGTLARALVSQMRPQKLPDVEHSPSVGADDECETEIQSLTREALPRVSD